MKLPKKLFAIYDFILDDIVILTTNKKSIDDFMNIRKNNNYEYATITDEEDIKAFIKKYGYREIEFYGGFPYTEFEFELLSEYVCNMNSMLMYDVDVKIIDNLKYLKLSDEDLQCIIDSIKILKDKITLIEEGPYEDDVLDMEERVYNIPRLVSKFNIDNRIV